jgi:hypothetical protein
LITLRAEQWHQLRCRFHITFTAYTFVFIKFQPLNTI